MIEIKVRQIENTHDWNNDKSYEGDLQTLNGKYVFMC